jgi:hypothetical protein
MPLVEVPIASLRPIVHCLTCGLMRARMRAVLTEELFTLLYRGEEITCYDDGYLTALGLLLRGWQKVN